MSPRHTAKLLAQLVAASALIAGCSTLGGIKDDYHTVGDASGGAGSGGRGVGGAGGVDGSAAGTAGIGGTAGADAGSTLLGATCKSDADCKGLTCLTAASNAFGSGGPGRGYCTKTCQSTPECEVLSPGAQCMVVGGNNKYCMLGCDPKAKDNCLNRSDLICIPASSGPDAGSAPDFCNPQCVASNDCGTRVCNLGTGLCADSQSSGLPVGSDCDPTAKTDPCQGFCIGVPGGGGVCTSFCNNASLGTPGACGSNPQQNSPQDAACLSQATFNNGDTVGICGQLCDCDSDCRATGDVCASWANRGVSNPSEYANIFHRAGTCVASKDQSGNPVPGIPSCPSDGGVN